MNKKVVILSSFALITTICVAFFLQKNNRKSAIADNELLQQTTKSTTQESSNKIDDLLQSPPATQFIENYGSTKSPPINDLIILNDLLGFYTGIVKYPGSLPTTGNADIVEALQGNNAHRKIFFPPKHSHLSPEGLLLDRWKQPLYFHFISAQNPEIRSAGPDQLFWTDDDLFIK